LHARALVFADPVERDDDRSLERGGIEVRPRQVPSAAPRVHIPSEKARRGMQAGAGHPTPAAEISAPQSAAYGAGRRVMSQFVCKRLIRSKPDTRNVTSIRQRAPWCRVA